MSLNPKIFLLFVLPLTIFLSFNKHSKDKTGTYHNVIWADAAGYYVYLPIWFIYGNEANQFPDSIGNQIGDGFHINSINNQITTKYPCGVAILETPFFLAAHLLAKISDHEANGFSKIYSYGLYVSGAVYCCFALFLISSFLSRHFSNLISFATPLLFFVSTNLYYYSIDAPGMSHIYSFFLFSLIIYITPSLITNPSLKYFTLFFLITALSILTRPTNIIMILFPLFYNVKNYSDFKLRLSLIRNKTKVVVIGILLSSVLFIPQLTFWYQTTGKIIIYSYQNESFIYWKTPKLIEIWFSTNNGLFLYTPIILLSLSGINIMMRNKEWIGFLIGFIFLATSYLFSSWWCWWFGCSFGARSFVEYYALLAIPLAYLLNKTKNMMVIKTIIILFIMFCCCLNMDIEYYYDGCFYGGTWDLTTYLKLLKL